MNKTAQNIFGVLLIAAGFLAIVLVTAAGRLISMKNHLAIRKGAA